MSEPKAGEPHPNEVIVGIEESASYVEDMWPDEVAFLLTAERARLADALNDEALRAVLVVLPPPENFAAYAAAVRDRLLALLRDTP